MFTYKDENKSSNNIPVNKTIKYNNRTFGVASNETFDINVAAITNKFNDVFNIVNEFLEDNELRVMYDSLIMEYKNQTTPEDKYLILWEKMQYIIPKIDELFEEYEIARYLNIKENDEYKLNITLKEGKMIYKASVRTRFFVPFYLSDKAVNDQQQKNMHQIICAELLEHGVVAKIFKIVDAMIQQTSPEKKGKHLWDMLSLSQGYTSDSHNLELISSIFYKALPSLKISLPKSKYKVHEYHQKPDGKNEPIAYLVSVAKNELQWLLQTAFPYVCIPSTIDISLAAPPKKNLLEHEVFYRTITKNIFADIADRYKQYSEIYRTNAYSVLYNLSQPFVVKIFDLPVRNLNIPNIHLINLFIYECVMQVDPNKKNITHMLKSAVYFDPPTSKDDKKEKLLELPKELKEYLNNKVIGSNISMYVPDKTQNIIKRLFQNAVFNLYRNKYYDVLNKKYYRIKWKIFIDEYVEYIYNIVVGNYDSIINEKKKELYHLNSE
jgi:hypothetical protein